jgi:RNA polymerase sigma-70 factor (ECF subfamily)
MRDEAQHDYFQKTFMGHYNDVYRYALCLTRNLASAEDLTQTVFLKAWKGRRSFRKGSDARAWLAALTRNEFINEYRKTRKEPPVYQFDEQIGFEAEPDRRSIDARLIIGEEGEINLDMLQAFEEQLYAGAYDQVRKGINPVQRVSAYLFDIAGLAYQEVAEMTRVPVGTVRSRLHRAHKSLRRIICNVEGSLANRGNVA